MRRTNPDQEAEVISLHGEGKSKAEIARITGIPDTTIRNILKRHRESPAGRSTVPARATKEDPPNIGGSSADDRQASADRQVPDLTQDRAIRELYIFINLTKAGYNEATKQADAKDKIWGQSTFLKLYRDGVKMLLDCTGVGKDQIGVVVSPLDDLAKALESHKEGEA